MAKKSKTNKNKQREEIVARYAERRAMLKALIADPNADFEAKQAAQAKLNRQPRDASRTRLRNRDAVDGRPRAYLRKFGLSRINVRKLAHEGQLPGITKSSW